LSLGFLEVKTISAPIYNGSIGPHWKWWQTVLKIEISCT
jgi:hypothetical protein